MTFIDKFIFPNDETEFDFFLSIKRRCYDNFYPFQVLPRKGLNRLDFEPITILYGGNGSGKTTVLNIIAEKLKMNRESMYNQSSFLAIILRCVMRARWDHCLRIVKSSPVTMCSTIC